jgi:hypothetical protein
VVDGCEVSLFGRPDHLDVPTVASRQALIHSNKENDMTITPTTLFRASGVAASVAGLIFVGVQINHPHLDATSITTTDVMARNFLKMLMAALALAGITGMYLRQVTKIGVLGLLGYVLFAVGFLSIFGTEFVAALVLPSIAHSSTAYVNDVIAAANNGTANGDIGLMQTAILFTGIAYLAGGFIFGIALFRANVLARWPAVLLALGTLATIATGMVPQYERLFPLPTGLALVGLGYSLWRQQRTPAAPSILNSVSLQLDAVGAK